MLNATVLRLGAFMAFCLAAHQYKVEIMNDKRRTLPNMTPDMITASKTVVSWSVDIGWMGFAFSVLTGVLWIRFSYYLASETSSPNKVRPTVTILHTNSVVATNAGHHRNSSTDIPGSPKPNAISVPKSVRWAANNPAQPIGRETSSTIVPNSRPNSGSNLLSNEVPPATSSPNANGGVVPHKHPMMVEDSV